MKRVHLWSPNTGKNHLPIVRQAAVVLAEYAVDGDNGRAVGDPIHEWVTEGRRARSEARRKKDPSANDYSSCGDLPHWMLACLGCRDEAVVNRTDDGGVKDWVIAVNLSRLTRSPWYVREGVGEPDLGDILLTGNLDSGRDWHACVLLMRVTDDQWVTADYGQPYGQKRVAIVKLSHKGRVVRGKRLRGWVSLENVPLSMSAVVPDTFMGGIPDDNPYYDPKLAPTLNYSRIQQVGYTNIIK